VAARLAQDLNASWGLGPAPYTPATLTTQRIEHGWSWGEVLIANRLAQQVARRMMTSNPTLTPLEVLARAASEMSASWRHGLGWGAIANASGVRTDTLVGGAERGRKVVRGGGKAAVSSRKGGGRGRTPSSAADVAEVHLARLVEKPLDRGE
jgi:hypothetical protein